LCKNTIKTMSENWHCICSEDVLEKNIYSMS
jgi:hypothetical protein